MSEAVSKILVVDDLEDNRKILGRHLRRKGCDVAMASNGREALTSIDNGDPEIVLLDIMMPEIDGFEVIKTVRENKTSKQPSIIAVSARHDTEAITKALNLGANDYVTKPYDFEVVWARVENQLNSARSYALAKAVNLRLTKRLSKLREECNNDGQDQSLTADAIIKSALGWANRNDLHAKLNHEIRTRLHQILGLSHEIQTFNDSADDIAGLSARMRAIESSGQGLLGILEDLNDFLSLKHGRSETSDVENILRDTVASAWETLDTRIDTSVAKFQLFAAEPKKAVVGNAYYIRRAVQAVLENAVKFSGENPNIEVRFSSYGNDYYAVTIEDNGDGIPQNERHNVLAPFYQIDKGTTRKYDGLGLGLTIANNVMTSHNGNLTIETGRNGGAKIQLLFPEQIPAAHSNSN